MLALATTLFSIKTPKFPVEVPSVSVVTMVNLSVCCSNSNESASVALSAAVDFF